MDIQEDDYELPLFLREYYTIFIISAQIQILFGL